MPLSKTVDSNLLHNNTGSEELDDIILGVDKKVPANKSYRLPDINNKKKDKQLKEKELRVKIEKRASRIIIEEADNLKRNIESSEIKKVAALFNQPNNKKVESTNSKKEIKKVASSKIYKITTVKDGYVEVKRMKDLVFGKSDSNV